jgi:hypothetical protein
MKVLTATFYIEGGNQMLNGPAIEHAGMIWLIAGWIQNQTRKSAKPKRLIALNAFQMQQLPENNNLGVDVAAGYPIPKGLFEYPIPPQLAGKFPVLEEPDITILASDIPTRH